MWTPEKWYFLNVADVFPKGSVKRRGIEDGFRIADLYIQLSGCGSGGKGRGQKLGSGRATK